MNYLTLKSELKTEALELRDYKGAFKQTQSMESIHKNEHTPKEHENFMRQRLKVQQAACFKQSDLAIKKWTYRHRHIAYSMMRGRTYEQIEKKCREDNKPDMKLIQETINAFTEKNVCASAS